MLKTMPNIAFDKKKNKWLPIFTFKKVMKNITNHKELLEIINNVKNKKNMASWNLYSKNFDKMIHFGVNSKNLSNFFFRKCR
jgi:predicted nucleotidyltransferase